MSEGSTSLSTASQANYLPPTYMQTTSVLAQQKIPTDPLLQARVGAVGTPIISVTASQTMSLQHSHKALDKNKITGTIPVTPQGDEDCWVAVSTGPALDSSSQTTMEMAALTIEDDVSIQEPQASSSMLHSSTMASMQSQVASIIIPPELLSLGSEDLFADHTTEKNEKNDGSFRKESVKAHRISMGNLFPSDLDESSPTKVDVRGLDREKGSEMDQSKERSQTSLFESSSTSHTPSKASHSSSPKKLEESVKSQTPSHQPDSSSPKKLESMLASPLQDQSISSLTQAGVVSSAAPPVAFPTLQETLLSASISSSATSTSHEMDPHPIPGAPLAIMTSTIHRIEATPPVGLTPSSDITDDDGTFPATPSPLSSSSPIRSPAPFDSESQKSAFPFGTEGNVPQRHLDEKEKEKFTSQQRMINTESESEKSTESPVITKTATLSEKDVSMLSSQPESLSSSTKETTNRMDQLKSRLAPLDLSQINREKAVPVLESNPHNVLPPLPPTQTTSKPPTPPQRQLFNPSTSTESPLVPPTPPPVPLEPGDLIENMSPLRSPIKMRKNFFKKTRKKTSKASERSCKIAFWEWLKSCCGFRSEKPTHIQLRKKKKRRAQNLDAW